MWSRQSIWLVAGLITCFSGTGCSSTETGSDWPDPVKVSGKVTYQGKPFANGTLIFIPHGQTIGQGGSAQTNESGTYTMQTRWSNQKLREGLIPGQYKVSFSRFVKPDGSVWIAPPNATEGPASSGAREELPMHLSSPAESKTIVEVSAAKTAYDIEVPQ